MAITAAISLSSAADDLTSNALTISTSTALTKAGGSTAIAETSGLARKTTTAIAPYTLFYADDYTADKAHKLYVKNIETTTGLFFTISNGDETLGRIYAQDWALIPWSAVNGTKATFTITLTNTWATGDTLIFDGVTATNGATETGTGFVDIIKTLSYPNWTVAETAATVCTFTAKRSDYLGLIEASTTSDDWVKSSSSGVNTVARGTVAVASANDIKITPSTTASHTLEYMLFNE